MGAFNDFNKESKKKLFTLGKSAIVHIGTAFYLKKSWLMELHIGTTMTSPRGVKIVVVSCVPFDADKCLVQGTVVDAALLDTNTYILVPAEVWAQQVVVQEGFLHPDVG